MDNEKSTASGAERRAHARYAIELPADVSLAKGRDERPGRILDYCIGGLFISVEGQDDDFLVMGGTQVDSGTLLRVRFRGAATQGTPEQEFTLGVRVCRLFLGGMGVAFDPLPDAAAILSLQALVEASQKRQQGGAVVGDHVQQAIAKSHQHLQHWLKDHLSRVFKSAPDELFIEARDATNNATQNDCMEAMKNADRVKPAVCEDTLRSFNQSMAQLFPQLTIDAAEKENKPASGLDNELSLVDTGSFDDWVTIKNIMSRTEPKLRDSLHELSRKLSTLTTAKVDDLSNPAGIQSICMGFNEAMQNLGLPRQARNAIYVNFEKVLIADFAALYKGLNKQLTDLGVSLEAEQSKSATAKRSPRQPPVPQQPVVEPAVDNANNTGSVEAYQDQGQTGGAVPQAGYGPQINAGSYGQSGGSTQPGGDAGHPIAPAGAVPTYTPQSAANGGGQMLGPGAAPTQGAAQGPYQGGPIPTAPQGHSQAAPVQQAVGHQAPMAATGAPIGQVQSAQEAIQNYAPSYQSPIRAGVPQVGMAQAYQATRSLMGLQRAVASGADISRAQSTGSLPTTHGAPSQQVMGALNQLQMAPEFNAPKPGQGLHLRDRLEQSLAKDGIQLSGQEREAVQVLSGLLESILVDPLIQGNMKPRIQRLAVPLTKVALQDERFFAEEQHPARQVVNRLGMLELPDVLSQNDTGDSLQANIDPLLERILADPHATPQTFESVLPELDALIQRQQAHFSDNIQNLVENRTQQQAMLDGRRHTQGVPGRKVSAELQPWFQRTERLKIGDVVAFNAGTESPQPRILAWANEAKDAFVFADSNGNQTSSMGQQELALEMLRGSARVLESADVPAMDRGVYEMLHRIHKDLSEEVKRDSVTGLMPLSAFEKVLDEAVSKAQRRGSKHALLSLNLDGFAKLNESCGRQAGDSLLRKLSRLLSRQLEQSGAITRVHADEFLLLLLDHNYREAKRFADRQCRAIENSRVVFHGEQYPITASLGLLPVTRAGVSVSELLENVQNAMLVAKQNGGNQVRLYDPDEPLVCEVDEDDAGPVESSLNALFESKNLRLLQQKVSPLLESDGKKYRHILIGIDDGEDPPAAVNRELVASAELSGKMAMIDRWMIRETLLWMSSHRPKLIKSAGFSMRLSVSTLKEDDLLEYVVEQLTLSSVPPAKVIFIIPETVAIDRLSSAVEFISSLKEYGCRFAIDDFGSGHTTFSYLKTLPVDFVRIDSGFVSDLEDSDCDFAMVKSINEIAHLMGKKTVAEGVTNEAVFNRLKSLDVDYVQGDYTGGATLLE